MYIKISGPDTQFHEGKPGISRETIIEDFQSTQRGSFSGLLLSPS